MSNRFSDKYKKSKLYNLLKRINRWRNNLPKIKYILLIYLVVVVLSSLLLWTPITQNSTITIDGLEPEGVEKISYIGALFTASSAFSDTGLVVVDSFKQWNIFGQAIISLLILMGGVGIFTLKIFFINWVLRNNNISLREVNLVNAERGGEKFGETTKLVLTSVKFILFMIFLFGFCLTFYFYYSEPITTQGMNKLLKGTFISPYQNWSLSFRYGFFHVISAINNAGFDIIGSNSLMPYYLNYGLQIMFIILLVIGGVGFPVIYDMHRFIMHKILRKKGKFHFSLFTQVSLICYVSVLVVIVILSFSFEISSKGHESVWNKIYLPNETGIQSEYFNLLRTNNLGAASSSLKHYLDLGDMYGNGGNKFFAIIFTSFSTRSAGFSTIDIWNLSSASIFIFTIAMFIGASPSSTGGGIRTTTFAVVVASIVARLTGRPKLSLFKRTINDDTVKLANQVFVISLFLLIVVTLITSSSLDVFGGRINSHETVEQIDSLFGARERNYSYWHIIFEISSAFGTTGLSSGITKSLNTTSQIFILLLMFIGQLGISSTLLVWGRKKNYFNRFHYAEGDLIIG